MEKSETSPGFDKDTEQGYVDIQNAYNEAKFTHIVLNKPIFIYFFQREDKKPLASSDLFIQRKIAKEDADDFQKTGRTAGVILTRELVKERNEIFDLFNRGERGDIKFLVSLETQLICNLFEQSGLTTTVHENATIQEKVNA